MAVADIPAVDLILQAAHRVEFSFSVLLRRNRALTPEAYWVLEGAERAIGVVGYTDFGSFAHIGLMAVLPEFQGGGTGGKLLRYAIDEMEARGFRSITLYSTDAGLGFYPRHGFEWAGVSSEWQLRRRRRFVSEISIAAWEDAGEVAVFDRPIFGGDRGRLLRALLLEFPGRGLVARGESGECRGFAVVQSNVIGPVAAENSEVACALIDAALEFEFEGTPRVLLPEAHRDGEMALVKLGFEPFRVSRYFYRGVAPRQQREKMYGQGAYSVG